MLERLFSSKARVAVLGNLLLHPHRAYHARELERIVGPGSYNSVWKELKSLEALGIVGSRHVGRTIQYQVNSLSPLVSDLTSLFRRTWAAADLIAPAVVDAGNVRVAFIYGSFASGEFGAGSDVDLIVIGEVNADRLDEALADVESLLGFEISYRLFTEAAWARQAEQDVAFVREVMAAPRLFVVGGADELEEVGRQRGTEAPRNRT